MEITAVFAKSEYYCMFIYIELNSWKIFKVITSCQIIDCKYENYIFNFDGISIWLCPTDFHQYIHVFIIRKNFAKMRNNWIAIKINYSKTKFWIFDFRILKILDFNFYPLTEYTKFIRDFQFWSDVNIRGFQMIKKIHSEFGAAVLDLVLIKIFTQI